MLPLNFRGFAIAMCLMFCFSELALQATESEDETVPEKKDEEVPKVSGVSTRRSEHTPQGFTDCGEAVKKEYGEMVEKRLHSYSIEEWFFDLQDAIYENNSVLVRRLTGQNHNCANMVLTGDPRTLLMYALEQRQPSIEVIQELLNLHFDLNFVPNFPGHTVLSYYEEFHPEVLAQEGMGPIINLLMNHRGRRNNRFVSLSNSSGSVLSAGSTLSHESGPQQSEPEEKETQERKKPGNLRLSGLSLLKSSRGSMLSSTGSVSGTSRSPHDSGSSSGRSLHNTPKPNNNNNSPKNNNTPNSTIEKNTVSERNETLAQATSLTFSLSNIVSTMVRTLTRSKKTKGQLPIITLPK